MRVLVTDREGIERGIVVRSSYVVVSIHDPDKPKAKVHGSAGLREVLYVAFHDAEPVATMRLPPDIQPMSIKDAQRIWAFVRKHQGQAGAVVVHCEQGMSRSPAVAAALCRGLGLDDRRFWREYQPNRYVFGLMVAAAKEQP